MATKIKIKLDKEQYDALGKIVSHVASTFQVNDAHSLYVREELEKIDAKLASRKWKLQAAYSFSLTISEAVVFMRFVGEAMNTLGGYERAICILIFTNQIAPQINTAVHVRMNFNNN